MSKDNPLIVGFVSDATVMAHIEPVAKRLGYQVEWVDSAEKFGKAELRDRPGEPVRGGQTAKLTSHLSSVQPALLIFDLDNAAIPVARWIAILKSSPATRRIPALAYGTDTHAEAAHRAGAEAVVTSQQFTAKLPDLINKYARRIDYAAIMTACEQPLSDLARQGIALFNQGEFYEAHHGLEDAWNADKSAAKELYRGILQVAVAYLQIERGNFRGAVKMFLRVRQWLEPLPDQCRGIDIAKLRTDSEAAQAHLADLGPEQISQFDKSHFKPVRLIQS